MEVYISDLVIRPLNESPFSQEHAKKTEGSADKVCWICTLPLGRKKGPQHLRKSRDHVIPQVKGGRFILGNIRWAHCWCNSTRGHHDLTPEIVSLCQDKIRKSLQSLGWNGGPWC